MVGHFDSGDHPSHWRGFPEGRKPPCHHAKHAASSSSSSLPSPTGVQVGGQRRQDRHGGPRVERLPPSSVSQAGGRREHRRRDRSGGPGQNLILGSGLYSPAPPTATPVGPSVATWTSQEGTKPPRFYMSRKPWGNRGRHLNASPGLSVAARRANGKNDDFFKPQRMDDSAEHPDAIRCFGAQQTREPVFAAAALAAARLQRMTASAPATVPPRPPTLPTRPGPVNSTI
ncbi:hypothetical protein HPB47_001070 [Ixodes persulcatus]|uniref:Uncharacterized protein n=1 Tax=Ixodes persulcatus TaxID=34615 RepID=A0AC60PQ12_IXOPE|nr:hypothetical protein HPB47_001070 [Ixodes persulcatus]